MFRHVYSVHMDSYMHLCLCVYVHEKKREREKDITYVSFVCSSVYKRELERACVIERVRERLSAVCVALSNVCIDAYVHFCVCVWFYQSQTSMIL